jgi:hypothetical protein
VAVFTSMGGSTSLRQARDRLILGSGYPETGLVPVNALGEPVRPELYSDHFRRLCSQAGLRTIHLTLSGTHWPWLRTELAWHRWTRPPCWGTRWMSISVPIRGLPRWLLGPLPAVSERRSLVSESEGPEMLLKRRPFHGLVGVFPQPGKHALTRPNAVGLARFELATP